MASYRNRKRQVIYRNGVPQVAYRNGAKVSEDLAVTNVVTVGEASSFFRGYSDQLRRYKS